jgi:RsiW-degrading membrane proteinase PrsW (M82 family)
MYILIVAAVAPAVFLLYQVYKMDKIEKEPWPLLRKLLIFGAIACIPAAIVELILTAVFQNVLETGTLLFNFVAAFVVAALVEEGLKFIFLYAFTFKSPEFNYRFDGVIYAVFVSMGFAILENVLYVIQGGFSVAISRALLSLPLHATCGVYMGTYYGQQKVRSLTQPVSFGSVALACLPLSVLIHGFYDFCAFSAEEWPFFIYIFIAFVLVVFLITLKRLKKASREDRPVDDRPAQAPPMDRQTIELHPVEAQRTEAQPAEAQPPQDRAMKDILSASKEDLNNVL